jgi:hypothetical protein
MSTADQIRAHQERCQPHLLRLRMLARGDDEPALAAAQAAEATGAIIAEVEAAIQAALAANRGTRRHPADRAFLRVRLNRLAAAAEQVVAAAQDEDTAGFRRHLRRFEALTSASWTVQHAVCDPVPPIRHWSALPSRP